MRARRGRGARCLDRNANAQPKHRRHTPSARRKKGLDSAMSSAWRKIDEPVPSSKISFREVPCPLDEIDGFGAAISRMPDFDLVIVSSPAHSRTVSADAKGYIVRQPNSEPSLNRPPSVVVKKVTYRLQALQIEHEQGANLNNDIKVRLLSRITHLSIIIANDRAFVFIVDGDRFIDLLLSIYCLFWI